MRVEVGQGEDPLTPWEENLLERLLANPRALPRKFVDYISSQIRNTETGRAGISNIDNVPFCIVDRITSNQTMGTGAWTPIQWNNDVWDFWNMHDPSTNSDRISVPKAGIYAVTASVRWSASYGTHYMGAQINGAGDRYGVEVEGDDANSLFTIMKMANGDYLTIDVYQASGAGKDVIPTESHCCVTFMASIGSP